MCGDVIGDVRDSWGMNGETNDVGGWGRKEYDTLNDDRIRNRVRIRDEMEGEVGGDAIRDTEEVL